MRIFKPLVAFVVALVFLAGLNAAISYAIEPFGSKSEIAWTDYAKESDIDTVIVGTSLVQNAVDPALLDELYGCKSFNMATPSQTMEESLFAIQAAYEDHGIKRAILGVSSFAMQKGDPPSLGSAFLSNLSRVESAGQNLSVAQQVLLRYGGIAGQDSINALFPWIYNHVSLSPAGIAENVRSRLTQTLYEAAVTVDPIWHYEGKGYGIYDVVIDYDADSLPFFSEDREDATTGTGVEADRVRTLEDMCAYCNERGIQLIAVSVPMPVYNVVDGRGYYELHDNLATAFSGAGQPYYDFNFARPELFESHSDYFVDTIHLNASGSRAFTESLARFLEARDAGDDLDALFYNAEEQRASVDHISAVFADATVDGSNVHVSARAAAGTGVDAEFQLCALDRETQAWQVVSGWTADAEFDYAPEERGVVDLRVNARQVGSQADCERYRTLQVYY